MKDTRTTFNVKVWNNRPLKRANGTHYQSRWFLDGKEFNQTFPKAKAADSHRSMLVAAVGKGEAFAFITGLPLSHADDDRGVGRARRRAAKRLRLGDGVR